MGKPRKKRISHRQQHRLIVRSERRDRPDLGKLSRALIGLARAEAEREAEVQHAAYDPTTPPQPDREGGERDA